jgi:outer membrane lipase/esterase
MTKKLGDARTAVLNAALGTLALSLMSAMLPLKAQAQEYNQLYIFGDSLVDNGNLFRLTGNRVPPNPYFQGRFSNGLVWVETLGTQLQIGSSSTNNFAIGGSTSGQTNSLSGLLGVPLPSLPSQLSAFASAPGNPSRDALFVLLAGANDYLIQPSQLRTTDTQAVVNNLSNSVTALIGKGARNIIVVNLPDLGKTPQERVFPTAGNLSAIATSHNNNLNIALQQIAKNRDVNIIPVDAFALVNEVAAEPGKYGFTNTTDRCFNQATGTVCSNPDQYLFWDGIHPTARAHRLIGEFAVAILNAPRAIAPQGDIALGIAKRQVQLIDSRLTALRILPTTSDKRLGAFLNGDVNFGDKDSHNTQPGYNFTTSGVTAGVDYRVTDNLALGIALGLTGNETNLSGNRGKIDTNGYAVSLYSNYAQKNFYANGAVSYGGNDFNIKRQITFDNRTATASTSGDQFSVNVNGGYIAKSGNVSYGPTVGMRYDRVNIDGYTEKNAGSLNMKVNNQEAESFVLNVGAQASVALNTDIGTIIPNIRASYEHQFANDSREITTEIVTQPGIPMRTRTADPDRDYIKLGAGAQLVFSPNLSGAIDYETIIGRNDISDNVIKGEVRYQF